MEIIVSHDITDLDGLAAMIAASKIYPGARPIFVGRQHKLVKNFMALYRDEFSVYNLKDINLNQVNTIIIVDTHKPERLGRVGEEINVKEKKVIVYDHHPHENLNWADYDFSREVGSATTILIEKINATQIEVSPLEATLFALGIYADTGKLTHLTTTVDDVNCLGGLLARGANLKIINEFLRDKLNSTQQQVFNLLIDSREDLSLAGIEFTIFSLEYDQYVRGLNSVIEKLKSVYDLISVFLVVSMEGETVIIGRSSDEAIDIGKICSQFGGGGHSGAGSATIKDNLSLSIRRLKKYIRLYTQPRQLVRDIMSSPVRTVKPKTTVSEAEKMMDSHGHNGLVVVKDGEIRGIFSRQDLAKVKGHNLMQAPVKGYMSRNVITIQPGAPVEQARKTMVEYNIGRLPVIKENELLGIITRSDILASYYSSKKSPRQYQNYYGANLVEIKENINNITNILSRLPKTILSILKTAG
ncbi:MAG: CBS domain-containing protein, partial [Halanaerobiales bacterium]